MNGTQSDVVALSPEALQLAIDYDKQQKEKMDSKLCITTFQGTMEISVGVSVVQEDVMQRMEALGLTDVTIIQEEFL